jgi:hypothetical protein
MVAPGIIVQRPCRARSIDGGGLPRNATIRGHVTITARTTQLRVDQQWKTNPTTVVLTLSYDTNTWTEYRSATGFTIHVDSAPATDEAIDWLPIW